MRPDGILANVAAFGRTLRDAGLPVSLGQVLDAARALEFVDVSRERDFSAALRANLVSDRDGFAAFERAFEAFWHGPGPLDPPRPAPRDRTPDGHHRPVVDEHGFANAGASDPGTRRDDEEVERFRLACSSDGTLFEKDFGTLGPDDSRAIERAIRRMAARLATRLSRRRRPAPDRGDIDLRRTTRHSLRYGGEILDFAYRRRRIAKTRIVLICDVSGSMDCYSRFLIQFMHALQSELRDVETFVFSTFLTRITDLLRTGDVARALERLSVSLLGWSGGTHIGTSIRTFNDRFARRLVTPSTLVLIISDGWERGDATLLGQQMRALRARCDRILWLNPLYLRDRPMRTFCKGMEAALPHIDRLLPANNLRSLLDLGRTLQRLHA